MDQFEVVTVLFDGSRLWISASWSPVSESLIPRPLGSGSTSTLEPIWSSLGMDFEMMRERAEHGIRKHRCMKKSIRACMVVP